MMTNNLLCIENSDQHNMVPSHSSIGVFTPRKSGSNDMRVVDLVSRCTNVPAHLMFHHSRCRAGIADARQLAMYLLHVSLGRTMVDVGAFFGRDRTTVSHACGRIEDRRDSPEFDEIVTNLEVVLDQLSADSNEGALHADV